MHTTFKFAAVAVLALVVGIGVMLFRSSTDQIGTAPSMSPSPTQTPLAWSSARIKQDWPAPVRSEPAAEPMVIQVADGYLDPRGDIEAPDMPWIDILRVGSHGGYRAAGFDLSGPLPSEFVVPGDPWVAYGLVFDTDLDGVADVRLGMDRVPKELTPWWDGPSPGDRRHTDERAWRADLRTGSTEIGDAGDEICDCVYPGTLAEMGGGFGVVRGIPPPETAADQPGAKFWPYPYDDGPPFRFGELPGRFYAWASVIQDGRVVATDYAPDVGWLEVGGRLPSIVPGAPAASPSPDGSATTAIAWFLAQGFDVHALSTADY